MLVSLYCRLFYLFSMDVSAKKHLGTMNNLAFVQFVYFAVVCISLFKKIFVQIMRVVQICLRMKHQVSIYRCCIGNVFKKAHCDRTILVK